MTVQNLHFPQSQRHHIHTAFAQDYRCSYPIVKDHKKTNKQKSEEKQKKVVGLSIFSSVQFWTKINNKIDFFLVFELNRTENWFKPINFGSVRFFSLPNQFKLKLLTIFFSTFILKTEQTQRKGFER